MTSASVLKAITYVIEQAIPPIQGRKNEIFQASPQLFFFLFSNKKGSTWEIYLQCGPSMLEQSDSLYLAVKLGKPGGFPGFPIPTPLPLSSALAQFGMMQRNLISFYLQCMQSCIQKLDTSKTVKVRILYFMSVGSIGQGPLNIWTEHSNCQIHSRGDSKPLKASLIPNIFLIFFYEIIFYAYKS